nr:Transposon Ty3-I Gag-Pol polyprotein [Ipomoea batatas]
MQRSRVGDHKVSISVAMRNSLMGIIALNSSLCYWSMLMKGMSPSWDAHLRYVEIAFQLLRANQVYLKFSKCVFGLQDLLYLGHIASVNGLKPVPSSVTDLRGFLSLTGYYRKFVRNYGGIAKPLIDLLRKGHFVWTDAALEATCLKEVMVTAPTLAMPNFSYLFTIETDASGCGIGIVLSQQGHPITFMSQALGRSKLSWSIYAKEMLAILTVIRLSQPYLLGRKFYIHTDKRSLKYLLEKRIANGNGLHSASPAIMTISTAHATTLDQLKQEVQTDPYLQKLVTNSLQNPDGPYSMLNGLDFIKHRIVVPPTSSPISQLLHEFHATPSWFGLSVNDATWEDVHLLQGQFPSFNLGKKVVVSQVVLIHHNYDDPYGLQNQIQSM